MRFFKQVLDFYINSSVHVALSVFALSWITLLEFGLPYDSSVLYFIFFASITGYNFVKYFGLAKFHHRRLANWLKVIQIFSLFCFVLLGYYATQLKIVTLLYIAGFGVITFLYAVPLLPKTVFLDKQHNLRSISGLKVYVIGLVWAGVTVFLPLLNANYEISISVLITGLQRFLFVLVLMLPFEIRDLQFDSLKLSTIPQQIGVKRTKVIGGVALLVFVFLELIKKTPNASHTIALVVTAGLTFLFIVFAKKEQGKYYSGFWVEALPILWLVIYLVCFLHRLS